MSYIGTPPSNAFTSLLKQDFSTSATTGYTLDHAVNNANDIALFINFVRQEPTAGYAASGTTLTLTSATASSDDMYCVYLGQALQTVNPPNVSVGTAQLIDGAVTGVKASGINTPAFLASCSSGASIAATTWTKLNFTNEVFDTNSAYDASNSKFTCPASQDGKYMIGFNVRTDGATNQLRIIAAIKINDKFALYTELIDDNSSQATAMGLQVSIVCELAVNDYVEAFCYQNSGGTLTQIANIASQDPDGDQRFWGYKLST